MHVTYSTRRRRVVGDEGAVELSPAQWQLFVLLRESKEPVDVPTISQVLYPDRSTEDAEQATRSLILRLREKLKEIGAENILVSLRGHGYIIQLED